MPFTCPAFWTTTAGAYRRGSHTARGVRRKKGPKGSTSEPGTTTVPSPPVEPAPGSFPPQAGPQPLARRLRRGPRRAPGRVEPLGGAGGRGQVGEVQGVPVVRGAAPARLDLLLHLAPPLPVPL